MLNEALYTLRKQRGLSCKDAGEAIGVSYSVYYRYETADLNISVQAIGKLAVLYGMEPWELFRILQDPETPRALWDYSGGDIGIYHECGSCGTRVLTPPGVFHCPCCESDSLVSVDIGNGFGGFATTAAILGTPDAPNVAHALSPDRLRPVESENFKWLIGARRFLDHYLSAVVVPEDEGR